MSFYVPTTSLSKFTNSLEFNDNTNEVTTYIEPLHITSKYVEMQHDFKSNLTDFKFVEHSSRIVRPPYWYTDLNNK